MSNLIFNAFAFTEAYLNSPQIGGVVSNKTIDLYMKNIYVSLCSAKQRNPQDDVALITNYEIPSLFVKLLTEQNIKIIKIDFNEFNMPKEFVWSLAFFKLCALKHIVNNTNYEKVLLIDVDTITINNYKELWLEASQGLLLYNVNHSYEHIERQTIVKDFQRLYHSEKNIVHYGGEFIGGSNKILKEFVAECDKIYAVIKASDFDVANNTGDETIISIAAFFMNNIIEAGAYICRYWTGQFYLVSTNYINNPVSIWHLPAEKQYGFLQIYNYLIKKGRLPDLIQSAKIFGLPKASRKLCFVNVFQLLKRIINKMKLK